MNILPVSEKDIKNQSNINWEYINNTLFIIPYNDGEAVRSVQILRMLNAPFLHVSKQRWGALLDNEMGSIEKSLFDKVANVAIFEIPGLPSDEDPTVIPSEKGLIDKGLNVDIIDHHYYLWIDRYSKSSSLEQLCDKIGWQLNDIDRAISVNDRSYIPGLKAMGLNAQGIREVRRFDLMSQGYRPNYIKSQTKAANKAIQGIRRNKVEDLWILDNVKVNTSILIQELFLQTNKTVLNVFESRSNKISFSGSPKVVARLLDLNFSEFGYRDNYIQYAGGDEAGSKFWGFKMKKTSDCLSDQFKEAIKQIILTILREN